MLCERSKIREQIVIHFCFHLDCIRSKWYCRLCVYSNHLLRKRNGSQNGSKNIHNSISVTPFRNFTSIRSKNKINKYFSLWFYVLQDVLTRKISTKTDKKFQSIIRWQHKLGELAKPKKSLWCSIKASQIWITKNYKDVSH